mmetsp:Transcript_20169/g.47011  ORF Transcript_20169/g.47011 Transcript_20169/m.47011 type:complete len:90 (+) Transcript_20169:92-361(+)
MDVQRMCSSTTPWPGIRRLSEDQEADMPAVARFNGEGFYADLRRTLEEQQKTLDTIRTRSELILAASAVPQRVPALVRGVPESQGREPL